MHRIRRGDARLGLVVVALGVALLSGACGGSKTVTADGGSQNAPVVSIEPVQGDSEGAEPVDDAPAPAAGDDASPAAESGEWAGPGWIELPSGTEVTYTLEPTAEIDGTIQGVLPSGLSTTDAANEMSAVLISNGYTISVEADGYVQAFGPDGDVIQATTSTSADPGPTMQLTFYSADSASRQGLTTSFSTLVATIDGQVHEILGRCEIDLESGRSSFNSVDGSTNISINADDEGDVNFFDLMTPDGDVWSSLGGDLETIDETGFRLVGGAFDEDGTTVETQLDVTCT